MKVFGFEGGTAVRAGCARVEKRINLLLQQAFLDGVQELFGLPKCQTQVLATLEVFLQGDEVGDGFFLAIIAAHDELEFDAHGSAPPGLCGGCMMPVIVGREKDRAYSQCAANEKWRQNLPLSLWETRSASLHPPRKT